MMAWSDKAESLLPHQGVFSFSPNESNRVLIKQQHKVLFNPDALKEGGHHKVKKKNKPSGPSQSS